MTTDFARTPPAPRAGQEPPPGWRPRSQLDLAAQQLRAIERFNHARRMAESAAAVVARSREMRMDVTRSLEVLRLLGQGRDPRGIAKELGVTLHTCRGYVKGVLAKLGVHSQLEAVVLATRTGLIRLGD